MEKLYKMAKLLNAQKQELDFVDTSYHQGLCDAGEAFDAVIKICEDYDKAWKEIMNEPAKISRKQFMADRTLEALNVN